MSNPKQLKFHSLSVKYFAGLTPETKVEIEYPEGMEPKDEEIDKENGLVIIFPEGFRYMEASGDQGTGKSSLSGALLEATGSILIPNAINSIAKDKAYNERLTGLDGKLYHIRSTKTTYSVEQIQTDDDGKPLLNAKGAEIRSEMKSPKTFVRQIVGSAGISPYSLKEMKPAEQVDWLRSLYNLSTDVLQEENKIKTDYDTAYKNRTKAGNDKKFYKNLVEGCEYWTEYNKWEAYFANTSFTDVEQKIAEIQVKYTDYQKAENGLASLKENLLVRAKEDVAAAQTDIETIEAQIKELQRILAEKINDKLEKENKLALVEERIITGEKWLEDNKSIKDEYDAINSQIKEATEFKANKVKWETMLENKQQMDHYETEYLRLTGRLTALAKTKEDIVKLFKPNIEGLEICTPQEGDDREGIFYKGKTLIELAESELWELATQIWAELNVKMVFVENISSLGSGAVEQFNHFLDKGGYIFATIMNRAEKNLKISFAKNIS